jgi:hypothetical protein
MSPGNTVERKPPPQEQEVAPPHTSIVKEGVICRKVSGRRPVGAGETFKASVGKLSCFTKIVSPHYPFKIAHVWYFGDTKKARVNLRVGGSSWRTHSSKTIRADQIGDWHVAVVGPQGEVLKTVNFTITP